MQFLTEEAYERQQTGATLLKTAADQFEDTFANIAHAYLQEKAIKLIQYLVGFEVVEKNDEGTKAIGMYGFKVGERYLYVPVFFTNGQVKPLELMYLKDEDLFVPLDEEWVNYLLKQAPLELGDPSDDARRTQMSSPNLETFATPPRTGRQINASVREGSVVPDWLEKFGASSQEELLKAMKADVTFLQKVSEFVPMQKLLSVCRKGLSQVKVASKKVTEQQTAVVVPEDASDPEVFRALDPEEKKKVSTGKTVIRDLRPEPSTSRMYDAQYTARYQNPVKSGIYKVIDSNGALTECLVLLAPKSLNRMYASEGITVIEISTGKWTVTPVEEVWVRDSSIVDDWSKVFKKSMPRDKGVIGDYGIFLNSQFSSSAPFRIASKMKDSSGVLSYRALPAELQFPRHAGLSEADRSGLETEGEDYTDLHDILHPTGINRSRVGNQSSETSSDDVAPQLILTPKFEGNLVHLGHGIVVPGNYRLYKLQRPKSRTDILQLGDSGALRYHMMRHNINELLVSQAQGDYAVSVENVPKSLMNKKSAYEFLLNEMGLHGNKAEAFMDEVDQEGSCKVLVKVAQGYPGPIAGPNIPDPILGPDSGAAQHMQFLNEELIPLNDQARPPIVPIEDSDSNIYEGPGMDTSLAMEAAGTGQQQVFDHALLATLAKTTQSSDLIQSYIPDLQTALDRLGRTLFLLWSKPEDFKDIYGIAELAEGEDKIRNVFRTLGEVLLSLKAKESSRLDVL